MHLAVKAGGPIGSGSQNSKTCADETLLLNHSLRNHAVQTGMERRVCVINLATKSQIMPNTIAARKTNDIIVASTFNLVLISIVASFACAPFRSCL